MVDKDLRKKIGQFFMISFEEMHPPAEVERLIREHNVGAILLFASNCHSIKEVHHLITNLKAMSADIPLALAVDHEGGLVHRLPKPATKFPRMRSLGNLYQRMPSSKLALDVGRVMGRELKAIGFDINFAPVVDVDSNPSNPIIASRSFGSNPEIVSLVASHFIKGLQGEGIAACAKHFPGHGDTDEDSHQVLPRLPHNRKRLDSVELVPFISAIQNNVASIMTAHVVYDGIDKNTPATFSVKILRDILRDELKFDGVIFSDSLEMKAIINGWSMKEAAVQAFLAGVDVMILGKNPKEDFEVLEFFEKEVLSGRISMERVEGSYRRITAMKQKFVGEKRPDLGIVGCSEHREILHKIKEIA